jgi:hypothetical protein
MIVEQSEWLKSGRQLLLFVVVGESVHAESRTPPRLPGPNFHSGEDDVANYLGGQK